MWWLSFRHGGVAVIKASSLVHARLLAARDGLGRASHFVEGYFIDPARMMLVPHEYVGRMLSPIEARQLGELLKQELREHATERGRAAPPSSRRQG
jgi:hypothetical protein